MSVNQIGQISGGGTSVPIKSREEGAGVVSPCRTSKMKFHEGLDAGVSPTKVMENYEPSEPKDITEERLGMCAAAGFRVEDIIYAFNTSKSYVYKRLAEYGIKLKPIAKTGLPVSPNPSGEVPAAAAAVVAVAHANAAAAAHTPTPEELAAIFENGGAPAAAVPGAMAAPPAPAPEEEECDHPDCPHRPCEICTGLNGTLRAADIAPILPAATGNEWVNTFGGDREESGPELAIYKDGKIAVRNIPMETNTLYLFKFNADFSRCRVERSPHGCKIRADKNTFVTRIRPLLGAVAKLGLVCPAKYRLDPATMEGVRLECLK